MADDDSPEVQDGSKEESDVEVSVQISDSANTLDNRFSVVILDVKDEDKQEQNVAKNTDNKPNGRSKEAEDFHEINLKDKEKIEISKNRKSASVSEPVTVKKSGVVEKIEHSTKWRDKFNLERIRCVSFHLSLWISLNIILRLINYWIFSDGYQHAAFLLFPLCVSFFVYYEVWVFYQLRIIEDFKWFKIALYTSWASVLIFLTYIAITLGELLSGQKQWNFLKIASTLCVTGTEVGLLVTSLVAGVHLTSAVLVKDDQESEEPRQAEEAAKTADVEEDTEAGSEYESLDCKAVFRCCIIIFLSLCLSLPISIALAIKPCSVVWLFAITMTTMLFALVVVGIKNHMNEVKTEFLWRSTLWLAVLSAIVVFLCFILAVVDLSTTGHCSIRPKVLFVLLDLFLMGLTLINAAVLLRVIVVATQPFRYHGNREDDQAKDANHSVEEERADPPSPKDVEKSEDEKQVT